MKLSQFENDEALELMADIMEPVADILADEEVKKIYQSEPKLKLAAYIMRNHKASITEIMARLDKKDPKTYRFNPVTLMAKILDLLNEPELINLFTLQLKESE